MPLPAGQALVGAVHYGKLGIGVAYALIYWGLLKVQAGMAQVILALVPLMTLFFAFAHRMGGFFVLSGVYVGALHKAHL